MQTRLWIPISSEMLGLAFVIAILVVIIYSISYAVKSQNRRIEAERLDRDFKSSTKLAEETFGFPPDSFHTYTEKYLDHTLGFATQRVAGNFGLSMCIHSLLPNLRMYFFMDFGSNKPIQAIIYFVSNDGTKLMVKQTTESTMFAHESIRYFHLPVPDASEFLKKIVAIEVDHEVIELDAQSRASVLQSIREFDSYSIETKNKFLTWRKA